MRSLRKFAYAAFTTEYSNVSKYFTTLLAVATLISVIATMSESVPTFSAYIPLFIFIEWSTVILFTVEYIMRIWISTDRRKYIFSYMGLIDLAAILPTYLGVGNLAFLKSARFVRTMRMVSFVGRTNISHVQNKGTELFQKFKRGALVAFATLVVGVLVCFLLYAYLESASYAHAYKIFVGYMVAPAHVSITSAYILVAGRVLLALTYGVILGYGIEWWARKK